MKMNKNIVIWTVILIIFLSFFISEPIGQELVIQPNWVSDFEIDEASSSSNIIGAETDSYLAFLSSLGDLLVYEPIPFDASVSSALYFNYTVEDDILILKDYKGDTLSVLETTELPILADNRVFLTNRAFEKLSELDLRGNVQWEKVFSSAFTSLDVSQNLIGVGQLDGTFLLLDREGHEVFSFSDWQSGVSVVYGLDISEDERRIAVIAGLQPQVLILFEYDDEIQSYRIIYGETLENEIRYNTFIQFDQTGKRLYFEQDGLLIQHDFEKRVTKTFPLEGYLQDLGTDLPHYFDFWQDSENLYLYNYLLNEQIVFPIDDFLLHKAWSGLLALGTQGISFMELTRY